MPKVYIIIVNWNGWRDTIECLESVFRLAYDNFAVIICDNASSDDSLGRIAAWADGAQPASVANPELQSRTSPPVPKPVRFTWINAADPNSVRDRPERLFLVQTGENLGFAGGNNVGLRLALQAADFDYAWLLNNDTVVDAMALSELVATMQRRPDAGMCGSTIRYYNHPETVQALGGSTYNKWMARGLHIGVGPVTHLLEPSEVERRMKYVVGASILVSLELLEKIGLMNEQYFLYSEEIDWSTRAQGQFSLAFAPASLVYHKEGSSIGTVQQSKIQPLISEYYATRNRILFTKSFFPFALPSVMAAVAASSINRLFRGRMGNSTMILKAARDGLLSIAGKSRKFTA